MSEVPTVFVIDDDDQLRSVVRRIVASVGLPVECFDSAGSFLDRFDEDRPGCVVSDLRMPGMSGAELQQQLMARGFLVQFILLSGQGDIPSAVGALKNGAVDFIEKPFRQQQLLDAVHVALRRNAQLRQRRAERDAARARLAPLSGRESEVLNLLVAGSPNKVIASRLGISENTVEKHRGAIMRKTGTDSLAELVQLVAAAEPGPDDRPADGSGA